MEIHLKIIEKRDKNQNYVEPKEYIFKGITALEEMIIRTTEIYFSPKISKQVEDLLKCRRVK